MRPFTDEVQCLCSQVRRDGETITICEKDANAGTHVYAFPVHSNSILYNVSYQFLQALLHQILAVIYNT